MSNEYATCREIESVTTVSLRGRLELGAGSWTLRDTVRELLVKGRTRIVLNLGEVISIDSAGIAELIGAFVSIKTRGGALKLLNPSKNVHAMLEVTRLTKVFEIYFEEEEALKSFH